MGWHFVIFRVLRDGRRLIRPPRLLARFRRNRMENVRPYRSARCQALRSSVVQEAIRRRRALQEEIYNVFPTNAEKLQSIPHLIIRATEKLERIIFYLNMCFMLIIQCERKTKPGKTETEEKERGHQIRRSRLSRFISKGQLKARKLYVRYGDSAANSAPIDRCGTPSAVRIDRKGSPPRDRESTRRFRRRPGPGRLPAKTLSPNFSRNPRAPHQNSISGH